MSQERDNKYLAYLQREIDFAKQQFTEGEERSRQMRKELQQQTSVYAAERIIKEIEMVERDSHGINNYLAALVAARDAFLNAAE